MAVCRASKDIVYVVYRGMAFVDSIVHEARTRMRQFTEDSIFASMAVPCWRWAAERNLEISRF